VQAYLDAALASNTVPVSERTDRRGDGSVRLSSARVEGLDEMDEASPLAAIRSGSRLKLTIGYKGQSRPRHLRFIASICDMNNVGIYMLDSDAMGGIPEELPAEGTVTCITEPLNITPGRCVLNLMLWKGAGLVDDVQNVMVFDVEADDVLGSGKLPPREWALGILKQRWEVGV
jgi:lipopolysaccharide transport system ATP-binding protein